MKEHSYAKFDKENNWIGVDFDGTIQYRAVGVESTTLGEPIPAMIDRIKDWRSKGMKVKIVTARVSDSPSRYVQAKDVPRYVEEQRKILSEWCVEHIGEVLEITAQKDAYMYHLYDDRAVTIERNTGKILGINDEW